ncbi:MAG TPA: Rieske 2Fe-2S domain-containing protein [Acetobacteraceae bacterium]|jgi:anthranilate 1,2-dioxygenase large subunit/terephthalate 1,2-dioxygenase oxygenase component alpha subunit|nr:Rieske 2Fe-2S domain-containing protein [Acetobacteraceae bacterium]
MPDALAPYATRPAWPAGLTRVPFWVYQDPDILRAEQETLFEGPVWSYLCLEVEIPNPGDWRATFVGQMPVVVARDADGVIGAFENRCAHRGALICFDDGGNAKDFTCAYHAWRYDLHGTLQSVAFQRGVGGKGGMPDSFCMADHGPRKLRVTTWRGLVFGTFSPDTPDFETFIGPEVAARLRVATSRKLEIIGRFTEVLPNNWKLYAENVRDTYHASLLHLFFATFKINRLSQGGGVEINETGGSHVSTTLAPDKAVDDAYAGMRSVDEAFRLKDPGLLDIVEEHGDRVRQQIMSVFPNFVMQRTQNIMAVRHFVPRGVGQCDLHWIYLGYADDTPEMRTRRLRQLNLAGPAGFVSMEDGCIGGFVERGAVTAPRGMSVVEMGGAGTEAQDTRATEVAIRGFWRQWRATVGV